MVTSGLPSTRFAALTGRITLAPLVLGSALLFAACNGQPGAPAKAKPEKVEEQEPTAEEADKGVDMPEAAKAAAAAPAQVTEALAPPRLDPARGVAPVADPVRLIKGRANVKFEPMLDGAAVRMEHESHPLSFGFTELRYTNRSGAVVGSYPVEPSAAARQGDQVVYRDAVLGADYALRVSEDTVEAYFVLRELPKPARSSRAVVPASAKDVEVLERIELPSAVTANADGITHRVPISFETDGPIRIADGHGEVTLYTIPSPRAKDAGGAGKELPIRHRLEIDRDGKGTYALVMAAQTLVDPATHYPVVMDPHVAVGAGACLPPQVFSSLSPKTAGCEIIPFGFNQVRVRAFVRDSCNRYPGLHYEVDYGDNSVEVCTVDEDGNRDEANSTGGCSGSRSGWITADHSYDTRALPCGADLKVSLTVCEHAGVNCTAPFTCGNFTIGATDDDTQPPTVSFSPVNRDFPPHFRFLVTDISGLKDLVVSVERDGAEFDRCECHAPGDAADCRNSPCNPTVNSNRYRYPNCGGPSEYTVRVQATDFDADCIGDAAVGAERVARYQVNPIALFGVLDQEECNLIDDNCNTIIDDSPECDREGPELTLVSPLDGEAVGNPNTEIIVKATDDSGVASVTIAGVPADQEDDRWSARVALQPGENSLVVEAEDAIGNASSLAFTLFLDADPPVVTIDAPTEGAVVYYPDVLVTGLAEDAVSEISRVEVNGVEATLTPNGTAAGFTSPVDLQDGENVITVTATDTAGNTGVATVTVTFVDNERGGVVRPVAVIPPSAPGQPLYVGGAHPLFGPQKGVVAVISGDKVVAEVVLADLAPDLSNRNESFTVSDIARCSDGALHAADADTLYDNGLWVVPLRPDGRPTIPGPPAARNGNPPDGAQRYGGCVDCEGVGDNSGLMCKGEFLYHTGLRSGLVGRYTLAGDGRPVNLTEDNAIGTLVTQGGNTRRAPTLGTDGNIYMIGDGRLLRLELEADGLPSKAPIPFTGDLGKEAVDLAFASTGDLIVLMRSGTAGVAPFDGGNAPDPAASGHVLILSAATLEQIFSGAIDPADVLPGSAHIQSDMGLPGGVDYPELDAYGMRAPEGFAISGTQLFVAHTGANEVLTFTGCFTPDPSDDAVERLATFPVVIDNDDPTVSIIDPTDGQELIPEFLQTDQLDVQVEFADPTSTAAAWVNGVPVQPISAREGLFAPNVMLVQGDNTLTAVARDLAGNETTHTVTVNLPFVPVDVRAPSISILSPRNGTSVYSPFIEVTGRISSVLQSNVAVGGLAADLEGNVYRSAQPIELQPGPNTIQATVVDASGASAVGEVTVFLRSVPVGAGAEPVPADEFAEISVHPDSPTRLDSVTVTGRTAPLTSVTADGNLDDVSVRSTEGGVFLIEVPLESNTRNNITLTTPAGASHSFFVDQDSRAPTIELINPPDGGVIYFAEIFTVVRADDDSGIRQVSVVTDPLPGLSQVEGFVSHIQDDLYGMPTRLSDGENTFYFVAEDDAGNLASTELTVTYVVRDQDLDDETDPPPDFGPPEVKILAPRDGTQTGSESVVVLGYVYDEEGPIWIQFSVNGQQELLGGGGFFNVEVPLEPGDNVITAAAVDSRGDRGTDQITVTLSGDVPDPPVLDPVPPAVTDQPAIVVTGHTGPSFLVRVRGGAGNTQVTADEAGNFAIAVALNAEADNDLLFTAEDEFGRRSAPTRHSIRRDQTGPTLIGTLPIDGSDNVDTTQEFTVFFSEPIDMSSVTEDTVRIMLPDGTVIGTEYVEGDGGTSVVLIPREPLPPETEITLEVTQGVTDRAAHALQSPFIMEVTTTKGPATITGVVVDPNQNPIANLTVATLDARFVTRTNLFGGFELILPEGAHVLRIDGRSGGGAVDYASVSFPILLEEGQVLELSVPKQLVPLNAEGSQTYEAGQDGLQTLAFAGSDGQTTGLELTLEPNSVRFPDGQTGGDITATQIPPDQTPGTLDNGSTPHAMWSLEPTGTQIEPPCHAKVPNDTNLPPGETVTFFSFEENMDESTNIGTGTVVENPDGTTHIESDAPLISHFSFFGYYVDEEVDVPTLTGTAAYLEGRVVDVVGRGIPKVKISIAHSESRVETNENGEYRVPLPPRAFHALRVMALVPSVIGAAAIPTGVRNATPLPLRPEGNAVMVFSAPPIAPRREGVTRVPPIEVHAFEFEGELRLFNHAGSLVSVGQAYNYEGDPGQQDLLTVAAHNGMRVSLHCQDPKTGRFSEAPFAMVRTDPNLEIRRGGVVAFRSLVYNRVEGEGETLPVVIPGANVRLIAFDPRSGYAGYVDTVVPNPADDGTFAIQQDLDLRPPEVDLKVRRYFETLDFVRSSDDIPNQGLALADDAFLEVETNWRVGGQAFPRVKGMSLFGGITVRARAGGGSYNFSVPPGRNIAAVPLRQIVLDREFLLTGLIGLPRYSTETILVTANGPFSSHRPVRTFVDGESVTSMSYNVLDLTLVTDRDGSLRAQGQAPVGTKIKLIDPDSGREYEFEVDSDDGTFDVALDGATRANTAGFETSITFPDGEERTGLGLGVTLRPHIDAIIPNTGKAGDIVTITGFDFAEEAHQNEVVFIQGVRAEVVSASATEMQVIVPEDAAPGPVRVRVGLNPSNGVFFDYISQTLENGSFERNLLHWVPNPEEVLISNEFVGVGPSDQRNMALLLNDKDSINGVVELTSGQFIVPAGMQQLLVDMYLLASNPVYNASTLVELEVRAEGDLGDRVVNQPFRGPMLVRTTIGNYLAGITYKTAAVPVARWAGQEVPVRVVARLLGDGVDDATPLIIPPPPDNPAVDIPLPGLRAQQGAALMVDNFRLSGAGSVPAPPDPFKMSIGLDGGLVGDAGTVPTGTTIYFWGMTTGTQLVVTPDVDGSFSLPPEVIEAEGVLSPIEDAVMKRFMINLRDASGNFSDPLAFDVR